jgi:hypothetical protein
MLFVLLYNFKCIYSEVNKLKNGNKRQIKINKKKYFQGSDRLEFLSVSLGRTGCSFILSK